MRLTLLRLYNRLILRRPWIALGIVLLLVVLLGRHARDFRLDASADSLVLENDVALQTYREIRERYGSDNFLILSYTPTGELFTPSVLAGLRDLRDDLRKLQGIASVTSILDVPLLASPPIGFSDLGRGVRTLETPGVDLQLARREFLTSPLYRQLLLSPDGRTTALQLTLAPDPTYKKLRKHRDALRRLLRDGTLPDSRQVDLKRAERDFKAASARTLDREARLIDTIRAVLEPYRRTADLHLGGVTMIVTDMIDFIRRDLLTFGLGVLVFLVAMLATIFRQPRWVVLPLLCCGAGVLVMFGILGLADWRVTVVSSNFTSLMLIITLSLTIHLVVRYHELHTLNPGISQRSLVLSTVRSKFMPSLYTALTTIVAFASLLVSDIRPVIDFGWMMALGISVSFILSFILFPAGLALLRPRHFTPRFDLTGHLTTWCARWVIGHGRATLAVFVVLALVSLFGIQRLTVENRFIDNFRKDTEIYQGMALIDRQLGGTTPLDVLIDADPDFRVDSGEPEDWEDDPFAEVGKDAGLTATSYWYNEQRIGEIRAIHNYLDQLPASGKVLSLATAMDLLRQLGGGKPLDNLMLAVIHKKLPADIDRALFAPYLSPDGNQLRFALRIIDSDPQLRRNALLQQIRRDLQDKFGIQQGRIHLSGMFVLYNNVLQSLFRSQILTLGVVFLAIMVMFLLLFRSLRLALIAIVPNLLSAAVVLGLMGWLGIPLDIMTITIAAITIGIAVDDTIHYVHRFSEEISRDLDYRAAVRRCHASVGRAMYYTSITIIIGFGILTLSNFMPTIYFGLFTGLAMAVAMFSNLTLLALLLMRIQPRHVCWLKG
ncbi:transporter [Geothermobacter hydrogeniphilus]|uniref:Transporter n=1 Tax=Geothermobacter hydrogeniphilus TaxID=1969733 RepID=A0A2K2HA20_9BACT|nr:MMPL family transporter [Geothermobacter hydrogeniphilus]PNU20111.1 transporter [Geothermobacter hydrogeniphilus]